MTPPSSAVHLKMAAELSEGIRIRDRNGAARLLSPGRYRTLRVRTSFTNISVSVKNGRQASWTVFSRCALKQPTGSGNYYRKRPMQRRLGGRDALADEASVADAKASED